MASGHGLDVHANMYHRFCAIPCALEFGSNIAQATYYAMATTYATRCWIIPHCHGCCVGYRGIWSHTRKARRRKQWRNPITKQYTITQYQSAHSHKFLRIATLGKRKRDWKHIFNTSELRRSSASVRISDYQCIGQTRSCCTQLSSNLKEIK